MWPIVSNATLDLVEAGGAQEGYRDNEAADLLVFTGPRPCYVEENREVVRGLDENRLTRGRQDLSRVTLLIAPPEVPAVEPGHNVTFTYNGTQQRRTVWSAKSQVLLGQRVGWMLELDPD